VPINRRNNCIYVTLGTCHSLWMNVWYAYRVTSTKYRIDTVISPDDGHIVPRNMKRKEVNLLGKIVNQFGFIYKIKMEY